MKALKFKDGTYQTEHGTIEVVLNEKEAIASGHYNICTNWVHITMADELFEDMEDILRDDIENRHLMLHAG